jgi:hypothetical protein
MNTQSRRRRRAASLCAAVVLTALTATGCHVSLPNQPTPPDKAAQALDQLKSLPSLEETKTQVQAAMDDIIAAANRVIPALAWQTQDNGAGSGCLRPYDQTGGESYYLPNRYATADVSEADWAKILQAAQQAAAELDATEVQVMKDQPGEHDVGFYGPAGIFIKISYSVNLVVSGYTGCRLPGGG